MGLRLAESGEKFSIFFWEESSGACPTRDYIAALESGGAPAQRDAILLRKRIRDLATHGPPQLEQHGHPLRDGIYELKARGGARLFWFYEGGRIIVCSHGAHKPKNYNVHIKRAQAIRAALKAQADASDAEKPKRK